MDKRLFNLLDENKTKKSEPNDKDKRPETPEEKIKTLVRIFCKGRYQSWIALQNTPHSRNLNKNKIRSNHK